jgi:hypothetical protein
MPSNQPEDRTVLCQFRQMELSYPAEQQGLLLAHENDSHNFLHRFYKYWIGCNYRLNPNNACLAFRAYPIPPAHPVNGRKIDDSFITESFTVPTPRRRLAGGYIKRRRSKGVPIKTETVLPFTFAPGAQD